MTSALKPEELKAIRATEFCFVTAFERAVQVFESQPDALAWLAAYNQALGSVPLPLLGEDGGLERVLEVLGRIEHGVFS